MPDTPPLSVKDQKSIQEKLKGNALLASLMMTSPASAFQYLGYDFKTTDFDDVKPPTSEDAALVKKILGILQEGGTILKKPHVIQPAADKASYTKEKKWTACRYYSWSIESYSPVCSREIYENQF